jgi:hypothetical protein
MNYVLAWVLTVGAQQVAVRKGGRCVRCDPVSVRLYTFFFFGILENVVVYRWCNCGEFLRVGLTSSGRDWVFVRLT